MLPMSWVFVIPAKDLRVLWTEGVLHFERGEMSVTFRLIQERTAVELMLTYMPSQGRHFIPPTS